MAVHGEDLAADLMETYGVCIEDAASGRYSPGFVATLALRLPEGCRWRVAEDPDAWWTGDRMLAAALLNALNGLIWGMSDRKRRGAPPERVGPSWAKGAGEKRVDAVAMTVSELLAELSRPREEASDGK